MTAINKRRPGLTRKIVAFRVDPAIWTLAQSAADAAGVSLPTIMERQLLRFVHESRTPHGLGEFLASLPRPEAGLFGRKDA